MKSLKWTLQNERIIFKNIITKKKRKNNLAVLLDNSDEKWYLDENNKIEFVRVF